MAKRPVTWFVLTDGSRARFVTRRAEGPGYDIVEEHESAEARVPTREIMSDRPGRVQESTYSGRHAVDVRHDAHRERKASFAREVANRLNKAAAEGAFDALVLYAAPRTLAILRATLEQGARERIKAEVAKDLTKVPLADLPRHFDELTKPGG
ncbi:MAG TPA: host attachment protein [Stellaceae bacterium]